MKQDWKLRLVELIPYLVLTVTLLITVMVKNREIIFLKSDDKSEMIHLNKESRDISHRPYRLYGRRQMKGQRMIQ